MISYSLAVLLALLSLIVGDHLLRTRVMEFQNKAFWKTAGIFAVFQFVFDNLFTAVGVWRFDAAQTLGVFIPFIPVENMVYGFVLLGWTIVLFTFWARVK